MSDCIICEPKDGKNLLFENDKVKIFLALEPSTSGHIQLFSKKHYTILEQVPDDDLGEMMSYANKMSMILFELFKVHGTNILINNGVPAGQKIPHFSVDIIPRRTDDGLKLDWELKQASPESLDSIQRIIQEGMEKPTPEISVESPKEPTLSTPQQVEDAGEDSSVDDQKTKKTNYYHKFLERIP